MLDQAGRLLETHALLFGVLGGVLWALVALCACRDGRAGLWRKAMPPRRRAS